MVAKTTTTGSALSEAEQHHLIGNALPLDFANTLYGHAGQPLHEYLHSYRDLVLWSSHARILEASAADALLRLAIREPSTAALVFQRAIALRETLYRIFSAISQDQIPRSADLAALNKARSAALSHSHLVRSGREFKLTWDPQHSLESMLWPIAVEAADLLTSDQSRRIRQCSGDTCDWLFVDTSRNHMRRWCSMKVCGNRSKVRRFLARQHRSSATA